LPRAGLESDPYGGRQVTTKTKRWPLLLRIVSARPRLFLSILAGFAVGALLPLYVTELRGVTRFLVAWDFGVGL